MISKDLDIINNNKIIKNKIRECNQFNLKEIKLAINLHLQKLYRADILKFEYMLIVDLNNNSFTFKQI